MQISVYYVGFDRRTHFSRAMIEGHMLLSLCKARYSAQILRVWNGFSKQTDHGL